jgi:ketopantoate reductase
MVGQRTIQKLVKAGQGVTFLDIWQPLIYAISRDAFAHLDDEERIAVNLISPSDCSQIDVDLIIIFVKSSSTQTAIDTLRSRNAISEQTAILTLLGRLDNPDIIASRLTNEKLMLTGSGNSLCKV